MHIKKIQRLKQRRIIQTNYKCDDCQSLLSSLKDYQKHVSDNIECKRDLPYSCQFCPYIEYEPYRFHKHHHCKPKCENFYKEKDVATGQIVDLSSCQVLHNASLPNQISYQYKRFVASGMVDTVQLNLIDNTLSNQGIHSGVETPVLYVTIKICKALPATSVTNNIFTSFFLI